MGLLVILAAAGGYYFYTKQKETAAPGAGTHGNEVMSMEHDDTMTATAGMEDGTALMEDEEV